MFCLYLYVCYQGRTVKTDVDEGLQKNAKAPQVLTALAADVL